MTEPPQPCLSLILITIDCLRADHVGFCGYTRPSTPFLDSLAGESTIFSNAIVPGAPTYYSFPGLLASRYPLDLGRDVVGLAPGERTLATTLQDSGYATAAFCAGNPYLTRRFGYAQGFERFRDFLSDEAQPRIATRSDDRPRLRTRLNEKLKGWTSKSPLLSRVYDDLYFEYCQRLGAPPAASLEELRRFPSAHALVDEALPWLSSLNGRPFFLWLHFMDPHAPYYPVEESLRLMRDATTPFRARYQNEFWNRGNLGEKLFRKYREPIVRLYDAGIRWVDAQVGRLIESLQHLQRWDTCVLALTADHGEEFLDHGGRFHSPNKITEELIRVPLLLRVPGRGSAQAESPFGLVHLAPTLLDVVGVGTPKSFRGRSHWQPVSGGKGWDESVITECVTGATNPFCRKNRLGPRILAVRDRRYKLVYELGVGREYLFDLERDPKELHPLPSHVERAVRGRLLSDAKEHLSQSLERRDQQLRYRALLQELMLEWRMPAAAVLTHVD
jgi:arylsulfatase A-like enzyme